MTVGDPLAHLSGWIEGAVAELPNYVLAARLLHEAGFDGEEQRRADASLADHLTILVDVVRRAGPRLDGGAAQEVPRRSSTWHSLRPGYDPLRDAISELGEQGAANALLWDLGGFGGSAVLYAAYSAAIRAEFGGGWLFRLVAIQAIAIAGGGLLSCDPGCSPVPQSTSMWLHTISGLTYFAITTVIPFVAWRTFRARTEWHSLAPVSLGVGLLLTLLFFIGPALGADRIGVWQRGDLLVAYAWQFAVALRLRAILRAVGHGRATAAPPSGRVVRVEACDAAASGGDSRHLTCRADSS